MGNLVTFGDRSSRGSINPKDLKEDLHNQMETNKAEGRIPANTTFPGYLNLCYNTLEGRKKELDQLKDAGNIAPDSYKADLEFIKMTQAALKEIDADNPISVLVH